MTILICDQLLKITEESRKEEETTKLIRRFFGIAIKLPMNCKMVLMNRSQRSTTDLISIADREEAFKLLAIRLTRNN